MNLAKDRVDIGLATDNLEPMLRFWQDEALIPFDHLLKVGPGNDQHRHDAHGSVLKINHRRDTVVPFVPPTGYLELIVAKEGLAEPKSLADPDGNKVRLVPTGWNGVGQIAIRLGVRSLLLFRFSLGLFVDLQE